MRFGTIRKGLRMVRNLAELRTPDAVAPGPTETAMLDRLTGTPDKKAAFYDSVPLKRGAKPEEIADAVVFLASDKASFITGQIIRVNGGKTAT
jgi:NAD(P)-dependent dehydrogenase (short-subunit alcohol dehydrogenase family)